MMETTTKATGRPRRNRVSRELEKDYPEWADRTEEVKRYQWLWNGIAAWRRHGPVNPARREITDAAAMSAHLKTMAKSMGADLVGITDMDPAHCFADSEPPPHRYVIAYGIKMDFDTMKFVGETSQLEVHYVYYRLADVSTRLAAYIRSFGYDALSQTNSDALSLIPYAWKAGLGELGRHGSLITPEFGPSLRLGAVSTNLPLQVDEGPKNYGMDDFCTKCNLCTDHCPGDAIVPRKSTVNGITRWHVDTPACVPYFVKYDGCKICLMVCPFNSFSPENKASFRGLAKDLARSRRKAWELVDGWKEQGLASAPHWAGYYDQARPRQGGIEQSSTDGTGNRRGATAKNQPS